MAKIIVTSRYLKSGNSKNLSNYVKYIATREGSVVVKENSGSIPATPKQQALISKLLTEFPESKDSFEYEDYKNNPTQKNASRFITEAIERNADMIANKKNYVGYLANRPGAAKFGSHGLFSQDDTPIDLAKIAKEIADHSGNVWTHVVSLRRDDAQKMGYDNLAAWRGLVKRQIPNIAVNSKINMANLKWYAAFHDKETNPHVHIIVYSTDEHEGFLTKQGIEKIRSGFTNDIYSDELHHLYEQQTDTRNLLKKESEKLLKHLAEEIENGYCSDARLVELVKKLHSQLLDSKGKKVYGYLKKDVKKTVDNIFSRIAQNESMQKMYKLWCEMEQSKHDIYSSAKIDFPAMVDNPHFKSVKNMIVKAASEIQLDFPVVETEIFPDNVEDDTGSSFSDEDDRFPPDAEEGKGRIHIELSNEYKTIYEIINSKKAKENDRNKTMYLLMCKAEKYLKTAADKGNEFAMYSLAKLYLSDEKYNLTKAVKLLEKACENTELQPLASYTLAKILLEDNEFHDTAKAIRLLESAADKNMWASYLLGRIHLFGTDEIAKDHEKGKEWITLSASQGNEYAQIILDNVEQYEDKVFANTAFGLIVTLSRIIQEDYVQEHKKLQVDSKLRRAINRKKQELGIKQDSGQSF